MKRKKKVEGPWRLAGLDSFEGEYYSLEGEYPNRMAAFHAGQKRLAELEKTQPSATAGNLQDRVYMIGPDGSRKELFRDSRWIEKYGTRPGSLADQLERMKTGQEAVVLCTDIRATGTASKAGIKISTAKCYIVVPGQKKMIQGTLIRKL